MTKINTHQARAKGRRKRGKGRARKKRLVKRCPQSGGGGHRPSRKRTRQPGGGLDIQKWISKLGVEFHWPGYQYMGPGTKLDKRLKRRDPGINRLDQLAKQHDIDYSRATSHKDKLIADRKMVAGIDRFPGKKTMTEKIVKKIMQGKIKLGL